jgi:hypothetical protein
MIISTPRCTCQTRPATVSGGTKTILRDGASSSLYCVVLDGLGTQVLETGAFTLMRGREFKTQDKINSEFVVNNPISDEATVTALYTDS